MAGHRGLQPLSLYTVSDACVVVEEARIMAVVYQFKSNVGMNEIVKYLWLCFVYTVDP